MYIEIIWHIDINTNKVVLYQLVPCCVIRGVAVEKKIIL